MKLDRNSLSFRFASHGVMVIAAVFIVQLAVSNLLIRSIQLDNSRLQLGNAGAEVAKILATAVADLTSSRLTENSVVVESKQQSVMQALSLLWNRQGYEGVVVGADGRILLSSLSHPQDCQSIVSPHDEDIYVVECESGKYICSSRTLPLWGWRVVTVAPMPPLLAAGKALLLLPLALLTCLAMMTGSYYLIRRYMSRPLAGIIADISQGRQIQPTGISEFEVIATTVNSAMVRLSENARELEIELNERKKAEAALRNQEAHFRNLLNFMEEGVYGIDMSGNCTFCNSSCLELLGYDDESRLLGQSIHALIHHTYPNGEPYPESECKAYNTYRKQEKVHVRDEFFWRSDGTSFPVEYWSHPIVVGHEVAGAVVTFRNVSDELLLQQQILQQQKLESIGMLAGGIAHDFNNLLTPVFVYSQMIRNTCVEGDQIYGRVTGILSAAEKARDLVERLLNFSRSQTSEVEELDLNEVVGTFAAVLERTVRETISFTTRLSATPCLLRGARTQLEQVILNLAVNAQDAIGQSGRIVLETAHQTADSVFCQLHPGMIPGTYVVLTFSDDGCGMSEQVRQHIFDPFYTTKPVGSGTGLGLSTVFGIVKQHQGMIDVQSQPGKGTTFRIYLPEICSTVAGEAVTHKEPASPVPASGELCILLVEDNVMVHDIVLELLKSKGHRVLSSTDPEQALELVRGLDEPLDVLVTDVVMPNLSGPELYEKIRQIHPETAVLLMSGYLGTLENRNGVLEQSELFIAKPFTNEEFFQKLDKVIALRNKREAGHT